MTQPSQVIEAIVDTLRAELGAGVADVRAISGQFGADLTDLNSLASPGLYVAMLRMPASARDYDPPAVDARMMVLCMARDPRPALGERTRDDVAMNLAAAVQAIVTRSRFQLADGTDIMTSRPTNVASTNSFNPDFARRGVALWRVEWSQTFELTAQDLEATLAQLREIRITAVVGGPDVDDVAAHAEL